MARYKGRHRKPPEYTVSQTVGRVATVSTAGLALTGVGVATGQSAAAAPAEVWDRLAGCESSGNWSINTGNGFFGGLQFTQATWVAAGGTKYASRADFATREQQIEIADQWLARVAAEQGVEGAWASQWPACSAKLGIRNVPPGNVGLNPPPDPVPEAPPSPPPPQVDQPVPEATYTVQDGDWLSTIADDLGLCAADKSNIATCWQDLYNSNRDVVGDDPNLILPGQVLVIAGDHAAGDPDDPGTRPVSTLPDVPVLPNGDHDGVVECEDFADQAEVQAFADANPAFDLDENDNGQACEVYFAQTRLQPAAAVSDLGFAAPLESFVVTQMFKGDAHRGIDLAAPVGTTGFAVAPCDVVEAEPAQGFGLWVICRTVLNGVTYDLVYGHMNTLNGVAVGQHFEAGDPIILTGDNGISTGPHLHFEVWEGGRYSGHPVDPVAWLRAHGVGV